MSDPGYEYLIERDPEFAADDGYDKSYWVYDNEIRRGRFNEGFMSNIGKDGQRLYSIIYKFDGWDGSVQEYGKSEEDAIQAAIAKGKLDGDEDIVKIVDLGEKGEYLESSRKLVKEGAGAGYTVTIKNAKLDNVKVKKIGGGDWEFEADIVKDNYMVEAADYYNLFCPMDSEFGGEEWVEVAGKVRGVCWWYDEDYEVEQEISGTKQDISFMYGHGWVHVNLPEDGHIVSDHMESDGHDTWQIESIELDAPQLAECVNYCHEHFLDEDEPEEDEEDEGELMNESLDEDWHTVTMAFDEFNQKLWNYSKQKHDERLSAFRDCSKKCEKALRDYYNAVVYDGVD